MHLQVGQQRAALRKANAIARICTGRDTAGSAALRVRVRVTHAPACSSLGPSLPFCPYPVSRYEWPTWPPVSDPSGDRSSSAPERHAIMPLCSIDSASPRSTRAPVLATARTMSNREFRFCREPSKTPGRSTSLLVPHLEQTKKHDSTLALRLHLVRRRSPSGRLPSI